MKHQDKRTEELLKQLRIDYRRKRWRTSFLITSGKVGFVLLVLYLSNTGTDRGFPISCFGIDVADSIIDIGQKNLEMMLLAKHGGGVGIGINQIRPAGANITGNGTSDGVVPFCKIYDSTILSHKPRIS